MSTEFRFVRRNPGWTPPEYDVLLDDRNIGYVRKHSWGGLYRGSDWRAFSPDTGELPNTRPTRQGAAELLAGEP